MCLWSELSDTLRKKMQWEGWCDRGMKTDLFPSLFSSPCNFLPTNVVEKKVLKRLVLQTEKAGTSLSAISAPCIWTAGLHLGFCFSQWDHAPAPVKTGISIAAVWEMQPYALGRTGLGCSEALELSFRTLLQCHCSKCSSSMRGCFKHPGKKEEGQTILKACLPELGWRHSFRNELEYHLIYTY